jgi:hypothetical protein
MERFLIIEILPLISDKGIIELEYHLFTSPVKTGWIQKSSTEAKLMSQKRK